PDSKHIAYIASGSGEKKHLRPGSRATLSLEGETRYFIVADGKEAGNYDGLVPGARFVFDSPTRCHTIMHRDAEIFLVKVEIGYYRPLNK
ncbi:MAG: hypothetical protein ABIH04_02335, partial [Planctomycetota bacterium]